MMTSHIVGAPTTSAASVGGATCHALGVMAWRVRGEDFWRRTLVGFVGGKMRLVPCHRGWDCTRIRLTSCVSSLHLRLLWRKCGGWLRETRARLISSRSALQVIALQVNYDSFPPHKDVFFHNTRSRTSRNGLPKKSKRRINVRNSPEAKVTEWLAAPAPEGAPALCAVL